MKALYVKNKEKQQLVNPSIVEHVKFRENLPRPLGKAKYYLMTDSERVP